MTKLRLIKNRFTLLLLTVLMIPVTADAQAQILVLWHADGTTTDVDLNSEPKVTFTDNTLQIKSYILDMEYPAEEIVRFTFKGHGTGIDTPKDNAGYLQQDGRIVFHHVKASDNITIYRPDGIRIPVRLTFDGSDAVLPLSSLPKGAYILSVNGRTSKFIRK